MQESNGAKKQAKIESLIALGAGLIWLVLVAAFFIGIKGDLFSFGRKNGIRDRRWQSGEDFSISMASSPTLLPPGQNTDGEMKLTGQIALWKDALYMKDLSFAVPETTFARLLERYSLSGEFETLSVKLSGDIIKVLVKQEFHGVDVEGEYVYEIETLENNQLAISNIGHQSNVPLINKTLSKKILESFFQGEWRDESYVVDLAAWIKKETGLTVKVDRLRLRWRIWKIDCSAGSTSVKLELN